MDTNGSHHGHMTFSRFDKRDPDWFDNGRQFGFRTSNGQLFIENSDGTHLQQILDKYVSINNPHFSKVSFRIVFVRFDPRLIDKSNIWVSSLDGTYSRMLTQGVILRYQPNLSFQEDKVVYVQAEPGNKAHHLWVMDTGGQKAKQLTFGKIGFDNVPAFSPDGKKIVFSSNREQNDYEIFTVDTQTLKVERLTHQHGLDSHPSFSFDGKKIVFVSVRSGSQQIWKMDADGSHPQQLTQDKNDSIDPVWMVTP